MGIRKTAENVTKLPSNNGHIIPAVLRPVQDFSLVVSNPEYRGKIATRDRFRHSFAPSNFTMKEIYFASR
jgi:hypothetical protein